MDDPAVSQLPVPQQQEEPANGSPRGYVRLAVMDGKNIQHRLYQFFRDVVQPQLFEKDGRKLLRPTIFSPQDASFWINPPEPEP